MPRAGFKPPPADDTSYEADTLPTKPPRLVPYLLSRILISLSDKSLGNTQFVFIVLQYCSFLPTHVQSIDII